MSHSSITSFRRKFPLLDKKVNGRDLIYFDNAATTQKPQQTIDCYQHYYQQLNANVHRSSHALSAESTSAFEKSRVITKDFINAKSIDEIIWTKGATESINLLAQSWGVANLTVGDEIILSAAEHHANIVPWQLVAEKVGAIIKVAPLDQSGIVDLTAFSALLNEKTKLVCVNHISNVVGKINPVEDMIDMAHNVGAITVIDGAQAVSHKAVDVQKLNCDFYLFSAHKMYGPTGLGVLYGRKALLSAMPPYQSGGEMIKTVSFDKTTFNQLPFKFEAGTPNIAAVVAFAETLLFIKQQEPLINKLEVALLEHTWQQLSELPEVKFIFDCKPDTPIFSFVIESHHNHDVAASLDSVGIAIRSGHHCAMPLMKTLNINGCLRLSLAAYNTIEEVDFFVNALQRIVRSSDEKDQQSSPAKVKQHDEAKEEVKAPNEGDIIKAFAGAKSWDEKHRVIMLLGKGFQRMNKENRTSDNLIHGCESLAWLEVNEHNGTFEFNADSDAKVIRGLLAIVLAVVTGKTADEIKHINFETYFTSLGLIQHLSPSRGNGLRAIVEKVQQL